MIFSCKPINATKALKIEPGGYLAETALLKSGFEGSVNKARIDCLSSLPMVIIFGSKLGAETMARISPEDGSIATILPILFVVILHQ
jgi:hypothetical protein